jgi:hypothetical protein
LNPNHYLAVAINYLLTHRPQWNKNSAVGKTLVSSSIIDRVVGALGRKLMEVPVGFKWFAPGLADGSVCFGGEESAGASFLRRDGSVWSTDKDGLILGLLAAEICARPAKTPASITPNSPRSLAPRVTNALMRRHAGAEEGVQETHARSGDGPFARRRRHHRKSSPAPRQQRGYRRLESLHGERLVRRATVRHGKHLQGLRRELQRSSPERAQQSSKRALSTHLKIGVPPFQGWGKFVGPFTWGFTPGCHISGLQPSMP